MDLSLKIPQKWDWVIFIWLSKFNSYTVHYKRLSNYILWEYNTERWKWTIPKSSQYTKQNFLSQTTRFFSSDIRLDLKNCATQYKLCVIAWWIHLFPFLTYLSCPHIMYIWLVYSVAKVPKLCKRAMGKISVPRFLHFFMLVKLRAMVYLLK